MPAFVLGECAIAQCDDFHYGINGELQDGCEAGSMGVQRPDDRNAAQKYG